MLSRITMVIIIIVIKVIMIKVIMIKVPVKAQSAYWTLEALSNY